MKINTGSVDEILSHKEYSSVALDSLNAVYDYASQLMRGKEGDIQVVVNELDTLNKISSELGIDKVYDGDAESVHQAVIDYAKECLDNDKYGDNS